MTEPDSTQTVSVRCNHCGAPLEIAAAARFLTCTYCGSQLEVHRSGGAVYTEVLHDIHARTQRIERDVADIKRQNAVEQLDREWEIRRQSYLVRRKDGSSDVPTAAGGIVAAVIAVVAGIGWLILTSAMGAPWFFALFALLFIMVGLFGAVSTLSKASGYTSAESQYRRQREQLLRELDEADEK